MSFINLDAELNIFECKHHIAYSNVDDSFYCNGANHCFLDLGRMYNPIFASECLNNKKVFMHRERAKTVLKLATSAYNLLITK